MSASDLKRNLLYLAVLCALLGAAAFGQSSGPITTPMLNRAYYFVGTSPYSTTIQNAVNAACTAGKGSVIVPPGVTPSDSPTAVTGCTAVGLIVQTTLPWACYISSGGTYSSTNCGTGVSTGVSSVSSGNLPPLFTVTVNNATTTPAFVYTLSNAAQNTVFAGPASGGAGAPSFLTIPSVLAGFVFYQTIASNGSAQTQRPTLNFSTNFTATDSVSPAQTTMDLANVGTAGTCNAPSSLTTDTKGRVSTCTSLGSTVPVPLTCNANGCYSIGGDGLVEEFGQITMVANGSTYDTATIILPHAMTTMATYTYTVVGTFSTDSTTPPCAEISAQSLSSASLYLARCIVAGAGGGVFDVNFTIDWQAKGY